MQYCSLCFSSVQSLSHVRLFVTPWIAARQASLSITTSRSLHKLKSIESVMPSSQLILCHPLLLLPPIPPSIRVFSNESTLRLRCPKYWTFSFCIIPSKEIPGLVSFRMDWLDLLAVEFKYIYFFLIFNMQLVGSYWVLREGSSNFLQILEIMYLGKEEYKKRKLQKLSHLTTRTMWCYQMLCQICHSNLLRSKKFIEINESHNCRLCLFLIGTPISYLVIGYD